MTIPSSIVPEPERPGRLAELGLSEKLLRDAMYAANIAAARVTKNHPLGWANLERYGYGIAELRTLLMRLGWTVYRDDNLEGVLSPDGRVLILISSGCKRTGRTDDPIQPETKNVKGKRVSTRVTRNPQTSIYDELDGLRVVEPQPEVVETWILLHHKDAETGEFRMELSCPRAITGGKPSDWRERIPLTPFPGDERDEDRHELPSAPQGVGDTDIDLDWREDAAGE